MRIQFLIAFAFVFFHGFAYAQEASNASGSSFSPNASKADQLASMPINFFTGMPNISLPLHSYSNANNGLSLNISLDYAPGGIRVLEQPTSVGLGWSLNANGVITRTVRGMPDDIPTYGFLNSSTIPSDYRSNGDKYFRDSLDSQPDVFSFNCPGGGSGKFFLGKNGSIAVVPSSKIRIYPAYNQSGGLESFRIVTEDGVKYDFADAESYQVLSSDVPLGYRGTSYNTAWYLSRMISPFNTDTIQFNYSTSLGYFSSFGYPQYIWKNSSGTFSNPSAPDGTNQFIVKEIQDIQFPDHTRVNFVYGWTQKNTTNTRSISKIKISDSIFRFGYLLTYDTSYTAINTIWPYKTGIQDCKLLLTGLTPFTSAEKQTGYRFHYHRPYLPPRGT